MCLCMHVLQNAKEQSSLIDQVSHIKWQMCSICHAVCTESSSVYARVAICLLNQDACFELMTFKLMVHACLILCIILHGIKYTKLEGYAL